MFPKSRTSSDRPAPMIIPVRPAAHPDEDTAASSPAHQPRYATRRAVLIHIDAATLNQLAN